MASLALRAAAAVVGVTAGAMLVRPVRRARSRARAAEVLSDEAIAAINGNHGLLSHEEAELVAVLLENDQAHLFKDWPRPGKDDPKKRALLQQLLTLNRSYNGGIAAYIQNAKNLLEGSARGDNPFEGYTPEIPQGAALEFGRTAFRQYEAMGCLECGNAAFVLVAGGIGERLGYSGIKVGIPTEMAREVCFLELYIEYIKALQHMVNRLRQADGGEARKLQLAIMTSDDTHLSTLTLLRRNKYFGLESSQVHLMKQEKVACISDNAAHLALEKDNPYQIQTKPHGHGDVHSLLYSTGLAAKWLSDGLQWVCFFQDTNALVFRGLVPALGVSKERGFDFNALAVPRKAKEAIGAITNLKHTDGSQITINVEYNQLEPLLKATVNPWGDVNDSRTGFSPYPGNINQLVVSLPSYVDTLNKTKGVIAEFVNPKYADEERTKFKKSTRLECMMQDYPKSLPSDAKVGFTQLEVWAAYSPVKNHPDEAREKVKGGNPSHSATSGELDIYALNCCILQMLGAKVDTPQDVLFNGLKLKLWPRVVLSPSFAPSFVEVAQKIRATEVEISGRSSLVIDGPDIFISTLKLDGALVIRAVPGAEVVVEEMTVTNAGWEWKALEEGEEAPEILKIRGFRVVKHETMALEFRSPGKYSVSSARPEELVKYTVKL